MNTLLANTQLELACRVASMDDVHEALADGADINCNGSGPLFIAIIADNRELVSVLVERGADVSLFEIAASQHEHEEIVDRLMKLAPVTEEEDESSGDGAGAGMADLDAKLVRSFDRMIRSKGLTEPFQKHRSSGYPAFADALRWIAAEECHAIVTEFLEMVEHVRAELDEDGIPQFLRDNAPRIGGLSERYAIAADDEAPCELLKEYLKERKKVA